MNENLKTLRNTHSHAFPDIFSQLDIPNRKNHHEIRSHKSFPDKVHIEEMESSNKEYPSIQCFLLLFFHQNQIHFEFLLMIMLVKCNKQSAFKVAFEIKRISHRRGCFTGLFNILDLFLQVIGNAGVYDRIRNITPIYFVLIEFRLNKVFIFNTVVNDKLGNIVAENTVELEFKVSAEEFEKANVVVKTIRVGKNNKIKESIGL